MTKYIFVTGGVVSSIGKGIIAASLGRLLKNRGLEVSLQKFDPYINVDPGTMSPYQHGEVFVTDDGAETDLDLGHYERFIDINLSKDSGITTGKVYSEVIRRERAGEYNGVTVQVIPHVTNMIKDKAKSAAESSGADILITEIGGTVGDIEGLPYVEAIRQFRQDVGPENVLYIHATLVPYLKAAGEIKTKPTQHSIKELRSYGIQPNMIVARTEVPLSQDIKEKLALFSDVPVEAIYESVDVETLYSIPLSLQAQGMDQYVVDYFGLKVPKADMSSWKDLEHKVLHLIDTVKIGIVGKYIQLPDAYLSVIESLKHAGYVFDNDIEIEWVDAETITPDNVADLLSGLDGVMVPSGFGERGLEGMITAIEYVRENDIPFFGIGLGMQLAMVEYARNELGLAGANTQEANDDTAHPIVTMMEDFDSEDRIGGTLRLGLQPIELKEGSRLHEVYDQGEIMERHRHRYAFNWDYEEAFSKGDLLISGISPESRVVEAVELSDKSFYIACQYHPEFISRPNRPHPLFVDFVEASILHRSK